MQIVKFEANWLIIIMKVTLLLHLTSALIILFCVFPTKYLINNNEVYNYVIL